MNLFLHQQNDGKTYFLTGVLGEAVGHKNGQINRSQDVRVLIAFEPLMCCVNCKCGKITIGRDLIIN